MSTVGKFAILNLEGDLEQGGFRVTLELGTEGDRLAMTRTSGNLPADPELMMQLTQWQQLYRNLSIDSRIKPKEILYGGSVNELENCRRAARALRDRLTQWLDSESFRPVDKRLREDLNKNESIRLLLRTNHQPLRYLPWHEWDFLKGYPNAELALSPETTGQMDVARSSKPNRKVRILAILGNRADLDTAKDQKLLQDLPDAEVTFLVEPKRQQINDQLWDQPWQILFFAGHSETEGTQGRIYINPQESLTLEELRYGLQQAIAQGLQLAIFNSCDGLGLAQELESLHLPQMIVMREPVPDRIAQAFLKYFLNAFVQGKGLYQAEREARERLQGLEGEFPCASWLPMIYQNSLEVPPTWQTLRQAGDKSRAIASRSLRVVLIVSWLVTSLVVGVRWFGSLQSVELLALDHLLRLRPAEKPDDRLLVVTIDEDDLKYQEQQQMPRQGSLSDQALNQVLAKLEPYHPAAIGLDIYRDRPLAISPSTLKTHLIAVCAIGDEAEKSTVAAPPNLPAAQIGFADLPRDPDKIVRRQILGMSPNKQCNTDKSLSYLLARRYLADHDITPTYKDGKLSLDQVPLPKLEAHTGAYHQLEFGGYETFLNYRAANSIAQQISLAQLLNGAADAQLPELVKDRVILIGTIARSFHDYHETPYGEMPGVMLHAHMVSQILSTVVDHRPLLWCLPPWGEIGWIGAWAVVGGGLALLVRSRGYWILTVMIGAASVYGLSYLILLQGGWVPLIPAVLVLIATGCSVAFTIQKPQG